MNAAAVLLRIDFLHHVSHTDSDVSDGKVSLFGKLPAKVQLIIMLNGVAVDITMFGFRVTF